MNKNKGIKRLMNAVDYSFDGFKAAWRDEEAFRQEVFLSLILFPIGLWLGETAVERALLVSCLLLIILTELLNSAIEAVSDRMGEELHPLIKKAKDLGAAAVFMALCYFFIVWGLILIK